MSFGEPPEAGTRHSFELSGYPEAEIRSEPSADQANPVITAPASKRSSVGDERASRERDNGSNQSARFVVLPTRRNPRVRPSGANAARCPTEEAPEM